MFAYVNVCPCILSPATRMRSVVRIRCVCGASVQSMPPVELREPSVRVRATAGLTSAVPFNQVSLKNLNQKNRPTLTPLPCTQHRSYDQKHQSLMRNQRKHKWPDHNYQITDNKLYMTWPFSGWALKELFGILSLELRTRTLYEQCWSRGLFLLRAAVPSV